MTKIQISFSCAALAISLMLVQPALAQSGRETQLQQIRMSIPLLDAKIITAPSAEAYFTRGFANYAVGKNDAAEADFAKAETLKYAAKPFEFFELRGSNFLVLKKNEEAVVQLTKALALKPLDTPCLINRASANFELGHYKEALVDAQKAAKLDAKSSAAQQLIGTCYLKTGQFQNALQYLNQAVANQPKNFEALQYRGLTYEKLGKKELAEKDFAEAIDKGYAPGKSFEEVN
ncbi:MAG: tetratricopeptide repeat protein [Candidatus Obscuribacterales bacterium]|jgi:tetratricopeptide (TPR) repeat protein